MAGFLLGILVGSVATAAYFGRNSPRRPDASVAKAPTVGRVDELSSAAQNAQPASVNAGDGTPAREGSALESSGSQPSSATQH